MSLDGSTAVADYRYKVHKEMGGWEPTAPIVVDVPIDLQGLPHAFNYVPAFHWQLTQRAIDYVLSGLPPLADRIGAAVARWRALAPFGMDLLGKRLFETYPASSLLLSDCVAEGYKRSEARYLEDRWLGRSPKHRSEAKRDWNPEHPLACILNGVRAQAGDEFCCDDDYVDALLCALTGLPGPQVLEGKALRQYVMSQADRQRRRICSDWSPPQGYRLLNLASADWGHVALE
jgi:hypothetical protein